jgi:transient receptor potential cation channel subfamily M protein 2
MITIFFEEIRQIISMELPTLSGKLFGYLSIFWNKMDVLSVVLFFIALILRFCKSSDCFCAARILLAIDLSIWYIRTLDIFSAVKQLGPKLVMIGEMVKMFFFSISIFISFHQGS